MLTKEYTQAKTILFLTLDVRFMIIQNINDFAKGK